MRQGWIGGGLWSGRRTCLTRSGQESAGSPNRPGSGIHYRLNPSASRRRSRHDQPRFPQTNRSKQVPRPSGRVAQWERDERGSQHGDANAFGPAGYKPLLTAWTAASPRSGYNSVPARAKPRPKPVPVPSLATPPFLFQPVLLNITHRCFYWQKRRAASAPPGRCFLSPASPHADKGMTAQRRASFVYAMDDPKRLLSYTHTYGNLFY